MPRIAGQILGLLHLSRKPITLDDMVRLLEISKGSASTGTRRLLQLRLIRQIWMPGERKDYFETTVDLQAALEHAWKGVIRETEDELKRNLGDIDADLVVDRQTGLITRAEAEECRRLSKAINAGFKDFDVTHPE